MKLGHLFNFGAGLVAGTILLAVSAQAAPVPPALSASVPAAVSVDPAVVSQHEVDQMKPVQVHWHHRHWHHRHWHRHHWHHRHWRHRHWRHHYHY